MHEEHELAALAIYRSRNNEASIREGNIDLHGLQVAEAEIVVQNLINILRTRRRFVIFSCDNLASHADESKLLPAVKKVCDEWGFPYAEIVDRNGFKNGIRVEIA
jgi:hypothetical protein